MSDELFVEVLYPFPSVCEGKNIVEKPIIFSSCTLGKGRFVVWLKLGGLQKSKIPRLRLALRVRLRSIRRYAQDDAKV